MRLLNYLVKRNDHVNSMLDSSGDIVELLPVNTTGTYPTTDIAFSTSYEPQTPTYTENGSDTTDIYLIPRGQSLHTTLKSYGKQRYFGATTATKTTTIQIANNTDKLITVGVTCGILGIALGIIITVAYWAYKKQRSKPNEPKIATEKNPQEKTFEPLDLTLTLPHYEPSLHSIQRQHSSLGFQPGEFTRQEQRLYRYKDVHHSFKLPTASTSSPIIHNSSSSAYPSDSHLQKTNHKGSHYRQNYKSRKSWDKTASLDNRVLRHTASHSYGTNEIEGAKLPPSIPTRESFSSGLGTCTESEICSFESRSQRTPSDSERKRRSIDMVSESVGDDRNFSDTIRENSNADESHLEKYNDDRLTKTYPNQSLASSQNSLNDSAISEISMSPTSTLAYDDKVSHPNLSNYRQTQISKKFSKPTLELSAQNLDSGEDCESLTPSSGTSELNEEKPVMTKEHRENSITIIRRNSDVTIDL